MAYACNDVDWPIIEFKLSAHISERDATMHRSDLERMLERKEPFVIVCDLTDCSIPDSGFLREQMAWIREHQPQIVAMNRGTAMVLPSALTRGMLRALRHFVDLPVHFEAFDTHEAALAWARARVAELLPQG